MKKNQFRIAAIVSIVAIIFNCNSLHAQTDLTLKSAIDTALLNNLGIQISKNNSEIAANNYSPGAAGMLPYVNVNGAATYSDTKFHQETSTGIVTDKNGVITKNQTGSAQLGWTIFNGARMFATYKRLQVLQQLGELEVKQQITTTIASVSQAYFELVRQQQLLLKTKSSFGLYDERMRLADTKLKLGSAARTELLQATVDYNAQVSLIEQQRINLNAARIQLNQLLVRSPDDSLVATDSLVDASPLEYGQLVSKLEQGNLDLQQEILLQQVADQQLKETRAGYYPTLGVNAGYNFNKNSTTQGLILENKSYGPIAGVTVSWNIFNGNVQRKLVQNAKLQQENSKLNTELTRQSVQASLSTAWQNYTGALVILKNESSSERLALENLDIIAKRFRLGESNVLELREAQQSLEEVQVRLTNANYNVNVAATQLKELSGSLVQ